MRRLRHLLRSRQMRVLAVLLAVAAGIAAADIVIPRGVPRAGVLVVDLRHHLPDKAGVTPDGRRSVSAAGVLRVLDAARHDRRIAGLYLRVGAGMPLAQAGEIADAVLRVRRAGKFAVVYAAGFTAANGSDRVLAAIADEIWTPSGTREEPWRPEEIVNHPPADQPRLPADQALIWKELLQQAAGRISVTAAQDGAVPASVDEEAAQADALPGPQYRSGPEALAEKAALEWGGADAKFVNFLTYREALDDGAADGPVIALIQADGILDVLEGPGPRDLAGRLAGRMRAAAKDPRVQGIVVRISAVAASDPALALLFETGNEARRTGTPVGFSFGPIIPANATAALRADMPVAAAEGALLIEATALQTVMLAENARFPWRQQASATTPAEVVYLRTGAVRAAVRAGAPGGAGGTSAESAGNRVAGTVPQAMRDRVRNAPVWRNDVGTLLDVKDGLISSPAAHGARPPLLVPYEAQQSVWKRTKARFAALWRRAKALRGEVQDWL